MKIGSGAVAVPCPISGLGASVHRPFRHATVPDLFVAHILGGQPAVDLLVGDVIDRMLTYPGPTYIIGIDERPGHERAYITSVSRPGMGRIQGLPATFPLDAANMNALWKEVEGYWYSKNIMMKTSRFDV